MSQVTQRARVEERRATGMDAERRVHRFVGFTFFALAAYVLAVAFWTLVGPGEPAESLRCFGKLVPETLRTSSLGH